MVGFPLTLLILLDFSISYGLLLFDRFAQEPVLDALSLSFHLMIVEDAIECIGVFFGMLTAFPIELAGIVHTLASPIRPPLYILKPLLQRFSLFCHFRVGNGGFGIAMIAIEDTAE